mmetsp:Transcript_104547/g.165004  ORF Transcript_104547/g.165004 Transcript_104547/m.165004 type:complete len:227 (-) Transcript_104547:882-1562(-)
MLTRWRMAFCQRLEKSGGFSSKDSAAQSFGEATHFQDEEAEWERNSSRSCWPKRRPSKDIVTTQSREQCENLHIRKWTLAAIAPLDSPQLPPGDCPASRSTPSVASSFASGVAWFASRVNGGCPCPRSQWTTCRARGVGTHQRRFAHLEGSIARGCDEWPLCGTVLRHARGLVDDARDATVGTIGPLGTGIAAESAINRYKQRLCIPRATSLRGSSRQLDTYEGLW